MILILSSLGILFASACFALFFNKSSKLSNFTGKFGVIAASIIALVAVIQRFLTGAPNQSFFCAWSVPYGSFSVELDLLSALFLFAIFILSGLAAIYGAEYLSFSEEKKGIGVSWFFFNILVASMVMVIIARNAILFLLAWEIMSVSSFFLVTHEKEKKDVQKAGLIYLVATHIGTLFLLVMFILLGTENNSFEFSKFSGIGASGSVIFVLAVIGFGTKAGFIPFHVWLPEAHPAAPSHVSSLMSGVMIKTGIYGLVRVLSFMDMPPLWWAWLLIAIGASSGIFGVLFALTQRDLKRLLANSSIENIGIIALGLGIGVLGVSINSPLLVLLGFAGALLHVVNHAFFKGLLFLGAGAVLSVTKTRDIELLGGLGKKMPQTALCFLIGSAAISGLPPLNGFISEFMIYLGAFNGLALEGVPSLAGLVVISSLALIGVLALACFARAFGLVFLGQPRSMEHFDKAREAGSAMRFSMLFLAASCLVIGFASPFILDILGRIISDITGMNLAENSAIFSSVKIPLINITKVSLCLFSCILAISFLRKIILKNRKVEKGLTWDCGYAHPTSRMQYTASSFAQGATDSFRAVLRPEKHVTYEAGKFFPEKASFYVETADIFYKVIYNALFGNIYKLALRLRWFQHGRLNFYILYILLSLLALVIWKFW